VTYGHSQAAHTRIPHVLEVIKPEANALPLVISVPHSGSHYPRHFVEQSQLDCQDIRKSEDAFVDDIFDNAPSLGASMIRALFPRAFLDVNREAYELDPRMFKDMLPPYVNTKSPRAAIGLGTIPAIVSHDKRIYSNKLEFAEAEARIERCYYPYHAQLERLISETWKRFGYCIVMDCHSMPDSFKPPHKNPDFVLGDRFGSTCEPKVVQAVEEYLTDGGYYVTRNQPYAGGYTTRHYGSPRNNVHVLQLEILRSLYMDERTMEPLPNFEKLQALMEGLIEHIGTLPTLAPSHAHKVKLSNH